MTRKQFWAIFVTAMILATCRVTSIPYTIIESGMSSAKIFQSSHFDVITDEQMFKRLFKEVHLNQIPPPVPPEINFENTIVLFLSMGEKPTAGYQITVERIVLEQDTLKVAVKMKKPGPGKTLATVITQPYVMVKGMEVTLQVARIIAVTNIAQNCFRVILGLSDSPTRIKCGQPSIVS